MSPCFLEAYEKKQKGEITEDEYLQYLLAHFREAWHDEDEMSSFSKLESVDLFGYSIWAWSSRSFSIAKDIKPLENVFRTYRSGNVDEIAEKLETLNEEDKKKATESLAALALTDRKPNILKFCLDRGFEYTAWFRDAANSFEEDDANADSDIVEVLQASNFREKWPWPKPEIVREEHDEGEETDPAEVFDEGGEYEVIW